MGYLFEYFLCNITCDIPCDIHVNVQRYPYDMLCMGCRMGYPVHNMEYHQVYPMQCWMGYFSGYRTGHKNHGHHMQQSLMPISFTHRDQTDVPVFEEILFDVSYDIPPDVPIYFYLGTSRRKSCGMLSCAICNCAERFLKAPNLICCYLYVYRFHLYSGNNWCKSHSFMDSKLILRSHSNEHCN